MELKVFQAKPGALFGRWSIQRDGVLNFSTARMGFGQAGHVLDSSDSLGLAYIPFSNIISRQPNLSLANNFCWMNDSVVKEEHYKGSQLWHIL